MQLLVRHQSRIRCIGFNTSTLINAIKDYPPEKMKIRGGEARDSFVIGDNGSILLKDGRLNDGFDILHMMNKRGALADSNAYVGLLEGCITMKSLRNGRRVHCHAIKTGFESDTSLGNHLFTMYIKCGSTEDAQQVFDKMPERDLDSWNILIMGYTHNHRNAEALKFFCQMQRKGLGVNRLAFTGIIKACSSLKSLEQGRLVHGCIFQTGFHTDVFVASALVDLYAKCGSIEDAWLVFDKMPTRDVVSWVAMIAGCARHGCGEDALKLFCQMQRAGMKPNQFIFSSLLSACSNLAALEQGEQIHAHVIKNGFDLGLSVGNALVTMYARCGSIKKADNLFNKMHQRDVISWNAVISGHAQRGKGEEALQHFVQMLRLGIRPNYITFASVLSASAGGEAKDEGKQVHAHIIKTGYFSDALVGGALVDMYAKCKCMEDAHRAFERTSKTNVISWNMMLVGYGQIGNNDESFKLFRQMQWSGMKPNQFTFPSVLRTCASLGALEQGEQLHTHIIKTGFESNVFVGSVLIDMYAKCGSIENARQVLDIMHEQDMVSWTAMIAGYAQHERGEEALRLFEEMQWAGMKQDHITFASALSACASLEALEQGNQVHAYMIKSGFDSDVSVGNALVTMYAKCGSIGDACKVFDEMPELNVISWNAMIAGYAQSGHGEEAMRLFNEMQLTGVKANHFTFPCAFSACGSLADLELGKQVHAQVIKTGFDLNISMGNAVVSLYSKCGSIDEAYREFDKMPERNVVSWNAMIAGYAQHGCGKEALQLFEQMQQAGIMANHITFVGVLSACSHVGLVDEGRVYFDSMSQYYNITPRLEHYACMVDLLGRAGLLNEAENLINQMPFEPDAMVWRTLLGACRVHGNLELGKHAAQCLIEKEPQDSATYVLLSNMYAAAGRWDDEERVRKMMKDRGVKKEPGQSWIEVKNRVHAFFVGDRLHPQAEEIFAMLERLTKQMEELGYMPQKSFVLHGAYWEQQNPSVYHHSEKLAISFGLISTPPGTPVRVIKNLRVCSDCHTAIKYISEIVGREIVVRDSNRYHHFKEGTCSCGDYW